MNIHRLLNLAGVAIIITLLAMLTWARPMAAHPSDAAEVATEIAKQEDGELFRMARAANEICGHYAAWTLIDSRTIQCLPHADDQTVTAQVSK